MEIVGLDAEFGVMEVLGMGRDHFGMNGSFGVRMEML